MPAVAILGASPDRAKFGNKAVRAYARQGWTVYPVHPKADVVEGLKAYKTVRDLPGPVDRVLIYLPPDIGMTVLPDLAQLPPAEIFVNPGAESDALMARARELGLDAIQACAIIDVGESPAAL